MRFLGDLVKCYADTIDYMRIDTAMLMRNMGKERWRAYYSGSVYIQDGKIEAGDVVVPIDMEKEMVKRLKEFGCPPEYIHRHPEFNTSHIHLSGCHIGGKERQFARIVSE